MRDKNICAVLRIIIFSLVVGYQVLSFFFWKNEDPFLEHYTVITTTKSLIGIFITTIILPMIMLPSLLYMNKGVGLEWRIVKEMYIEPPSFNADLFDISNPLNIFQDISYLFLSFALPNLVLYLVFKKQLIGVAVEDTGIAIGMIIGIQIALRLMRGKF
jgi:hypothetical protein